MRKLLDLVSEAYGRRKRERTAIQTVHRTDPDQRLPPFTQYKPVVLDCVVENRSREVDGEVRQGWEALKESLETEDKVEDLQEVRSRERME